MQCTNLVCSFAFAKGTGITLRTDESLKTNEADSAFIMRPFLFLFLPVLFSCSWLHEWKATQAHMLRFVSTRWGSRAGTRGEMRSGLLLFISELKKTEQGGLWQKYHIMSSVTVLLWMRPKWNSLLYYILVLRANIIEDKLLLKDMPFIMVWTKLPDLLLYSIIFHTAVLQTQQTFRRRQVNLNQCKLFTVWHEDDVFFVLSDMKDFGKWAHLLS